MGRSQAKSWSSAPKSGPAAARRKGPSASVASDFAVSDSDNEQDDAFEKRRDKISLSGGRGKGKPADDSDDEEQDEEVMGLGDDDDDEDDEDEDEGEDYSEDEQDDDALIEAALDKGGRSAEIAKQAKMIGARLKLQRKEDEDDEEQGDEPDERWGANKRRYYDADTTGLEGSDDEEALQEEEEEVARLEKEKAARMSASDFGLEEEEEEDDDEDTMGALAKNKAKPASGRKAAPVVVEAVSKQLSDLSAEERGAALLADAPELLALLQDLTDSLAEVRGRVGPLLAEVRSGGLATREGVSYLEAKHLLLLQYCTHIVFYILLKAEGRPVKDHPVIGRLVELRAYLEKIRPIDKRLQYQVERLIKAAQIAAKQDAQLRGGKKGAGAMAEDGVDAAVDEDDEGDATRFGPRRDSLVAKAGGKAAAGAAKGGDDDRAGVYRPPKINPVSMEGDVDRADMSRNESRLLKEARRKASRSELVRELAEDVTGAPRELRQEMPGFDSLASVKQRQRLEARAAVEEDMMSRVPLSKDEAKKMKQQQRAGMSGKSMLDDFADEVADIVGLSQEGGGKSASRLADLFSRQKVSQKFGAEAPRAASHGGDEDLPRREALQDRRIKYDAVVARRAAAARDGNDDDEDLPDSEFFGGGDGERSAAKRRAGGEEDELYLEAKAAASDRKRAREGKYAGAPALHPPLPDEAPQGARGITTEIERNRGLTPHRRKDLKNPRKKHRIKFADAQVRHRGAVQEVRKPTGSTYGGETTGVKSRIVKSRKLG